MFYLIIIQEPLFAQAGKRSSQEARQASLPQGKIGLTVPGGSNPTATTYWLCAVGQVTYLPVTVLKIEAIIPASSATRDNGSGRNSFAERVRCSDAPWKSEPLAPPLTFPFPIPPG